MTRTAEQTVREVMSYGSGGCDYHLCGWKPCRRRLPCPDAHRNLSPCACEHPSLALVEDEGRPLEPHETGTTELFFCDSKTCLQKWLESYFVCDSDSEDEEGPAP